MIENFIQIVRMCAGPEWLPDEIRISSSNKPLPLPYEWSQTKLTWGAQSTQINIPDRILALSPLKLELQTLDLPDINDDRQSTELNFSSLVRGQIYARKVGMEMAANQLGMSPKTLQRKLLQEKTTYSEILEQNRIGLAKELLETTDLSLSNISYKLGYQHHANFTRSFKRLCGITPSAYKNLIR
jgi:AraC-like DNA-binding protein